MQRLIRRRPSPALIVACIALLVALSGTGIAAVNALPRNSVGNAQLRNNSVTSLKVRNGPPASELPPLKVIAAPPTAPSLPRI